MSDSSSRFCSGTSTQIDSKMVDFEKYNSIIRFVILSLMIIQTIIATVYIFCGKSKEQRPLFVTL